MTIKNIIRMAREAFIKRGFWPNEIMWECWKDAWIAGAAAEREAMVALAAKQGWAMKNEDPFEDAVREIAAIRTRGQA